MSDRPTTLERAYELARSGQCASTSEVRSRLYAENFADVRAHLHGAMILADLRRLCLAAIAGLDPVAD